MQARFATNGLLAVLVVTLGALLARIPRSEEQRWRPLSESAVLLVISLSSPICWTHHLLVLIPVLTALGSFSSRKVQLAWPITIAFLLTSRPLALDDAEFGPKWLFSVHLFAGCTFALLLCVGMIVYVAWRDREKDAA